jgi:hypothetical protein
LPEGTRAFLLDASALSIIPGDFNRNGIVDAADYVVWRNSPSNFGGDPGGYNNWRANFRRTFGSGAAAVENSVPEPGNLVPLALIAATLLRRHLSR